MGFQTLKKSAFKAAKGLWSSFPMLLGTILLISIISAVVPKSFYVSIFTKNPLFDSVIGDLVGSISAGNPITSYIIGGELLNQGVGLLTVTAFLVAWVTVGIIQLPAESAMLGKKFALARNFTAFLLALLVAFSTVVILNILH